MCLQGNGSTSSIVLKGERQKVGVGTSHARHRAARQSAFAGAHLLITDTAPADYPRLLDALLLRLLRRRESRARRLELPHFGSDKPDNIITFVVFV